MVRYLAFRGIVISYRKLERGFTRHTGNSKDIIMVKGLSTFQHIQAIVKSYRAQKIACQCSDFSSEGFKLIAPLYTCNDKVEYVHVVFTRVVSPMEYLATVKPARFGANTFVVVENMNMIDWSK
jgi:hypothetical protein